MLFFLREVNPYICLYIYIYIYIRLSYCLNKYKYTEGLRKGCGETIKGV